MMLWLRVGYGETEAGAPNSGGGGGGRCRGSQDLTKEGGDGGMGEGVSNNFFFKR